MLRAAIDIGTNSILLLIADLSGNKLNVIREEQELPRLGKGVDQNRILQAESMERVLTVLKGYKSILSNTHPDLPLQTVVSATSAVRDAQNRDEFTDMVRRETGWTIRLLSGEEEAYITYFGAMRILDINHRDRYLVIDIGGGSTELAFGSGERFMNGISVDMGSVRFTERYLCNQPPTAEEMLRARKAVESHLNGFLTTGAIDELVGVAGTVTTLVAVIQNMNSYDIKRVNGSRLKRDDLSAFIRKIASLSYDEIERINPLFLKGRADIILAGAVIVDGIMQLCGHESMTVSTGGIRHGLLRI